MKGDKRIKIKEVQQRIEQEMKGDLRIVAYFEPYQESSVNSFIEAYADIRATLEVYGDFTKYRQEGIIEAIITPPGKHSNTSNIKNYLMWSVNGEPSSFPM